MGRWRDGFGWFREEGREGGREGMEGCVFVWVRMDSRFGTSTT